MAMRKLPRFLTSLEIAAMFKVAKKKPRDLMLLKCLYFLGLRSSEVQKMEVDEIDFINSNFKVVEGKGLKDRYIPIPKGLIEDLKEWIKGKEGFLFPGRSKGLISNRHIRRLVKKYANIAGIRKSDEIHPHTLRHSYATHLQNKGVALTVIQRLLGHDSIETTSIYTHTGTERAKRLVDEAFSDFE